MRHCSLPSSQPSGEHPTFVFGSGRSSIFYTVSGGLTDASASDTAETIVQRADQAFYLTKAAGRDRITTLTHDMDLAGKTA